MAQRPGVSEDKPLDVAGGRSVRESSFALVANGFADGPAQAMRDYLVSQQAGRVIAVNHPLSAEEGNAHRLSEWVNGRLTRTRSIRLPSRPPLTYPLDILAPLALGAVDVWFGFNPLNVMQGLGARRVRRARRVIYWGVDFVVTRFGRGPLTSIYERIEGVACRSSDARFELSAAMRDARNARHSREGRHLAPARVVPMGAWTRRVPKCPADAYKKRTVTYMGHLLPKQGLLELLEAISVLKTRGIAARLDVIGRGPQEAELRERANRLGIDGEVRFLGFVEDHRELERMVAEGSIGAAPYATGAASSYTVFADPGKLKIYLAAGLPIVTTDAAPVASELAEAGAAVLVDFTVPAIAAAIERLLISPEEWQRTRTAALKVADDYDWEVILSKALGWLGFD
jgi:glycosyltransferase involved in cell wall biosynthesis